MVKKEGPRKGRFFYKCEQRECEFFEWEKKDDAMSVDSYSLIGTTSRRSKSPRREMVDTPGRTQGVLPVDLTQEFEEAIRCDSEGL